MFLAVVAPLVAHREQHNEHGDEAQQTGTHEGAGIAPTCHQAAERRPDQEAGVEAGSEDTKGLAAPLWRDGIGDEGAGRGQDARRHRPLDETQDDEGQRVDHRQIGEGQHDLHGQARQQDRPAPPAVGQPARGVLEEEVRQQEGRGHGADDRQGGAVGLSVEDAHGHHHADAGEADGDDEGDGQQGAMAKHGYGLPGHYRVQSLSYHPILEPFDATAFLRPALERSTLTLTRSQGEIRRVGAGQQRRSLPSFGMGGIHWVKVASRAGSGLLVAAMPRSAAPGFGYGNHSGCAMRAGICTGREQGSAVATWRRPITCLCRAAASRPDTVVARGYANSPLVRRAGGLAQRSMTVAATDPLRALYPNIPSHEWDRGACGVGLIANMNLRPTRDLVREALDALGCLTHRGGRSQTDAQDPGTSDGAGLLVDIVPEFYVEAFGLLGFDGDRVGAAAPFGVGMLFLPHDCSGRALITAETRKSGLRVLGWRDVPVELEVLGRRARQTMPLITQMLIERPDGVEPARFEQLLYRLRRRIERRAARDGVDLTVASLSAQTVVYKGLVNATALGDFYAADLGHPDFVASVAMYHQRYATNTLPDWALAQPFHRLCHNGEINTLLGNRGWVQARERALPPHERRLLTPLLGNGSDSAQLDRLVEALTLRGVPPVQAVLGLVPEAHAAVPEMHPQLRAWYRLQGALREPWDGPAALLYLDEHWAIAHLDRNGLRPLFLEETGGNGHPPQLVVSSEQGVTAHQHDDIIYTHQMAPGEIVAFDRHTGRGYHDTEVKAELIALTEDWQSQLEHHVWSAGISPVSPAPPDAQGFLRRQIAAGVTLDDLTYFMLPMVRKGKEAVWSMGDDTQLTPFVSRPRLFADHLRQRFAQVTNPPIDPYREGAVFDTTVYLGRLEGFFGGPIGGHTVALEAPILSAERYTWVRGQSGSRCLSTSFPVAGGAAAAHDALSALEREAVAAARAGAGCLILSDADGVDEDHASLPMPLAAGAVHQALSRAGLRARVGLVVETAQAWHEHHLAVLLGLGTDAVYPWMALRWAEQLASDDEESSPDPGGERLRRVLLTGVTQVMSKMGICAAASYIGSQLFDALGLEEEVTARCCPGVGRWGRGVGLDDLIEDVLGFHQAAWAAEPALADAGFVRYRKGGIPRAFEPRVFAGLPKVVAETPEEMECFVRSEGKPPERFVQDFLEVLEPAARKRYAAWAETINCREPVTVGDRYEIVSDRPPIAIEEVEPVWKILNDCEGLGRVCGGAMSWGSLSDEAHEDIAVAMNRVGAKSNTGEGGERAHRYGGPANSAIKQVASARFGVTPQYLHHLHEWQIKMAQGSKPGEGGQLPGHKVSSAIAEVRGSNRGVELISPPPHHDIYSIEDLAELMYELYQFKPSSTGNVKLVSETGVSIVAAGVAKGGAQTIHISGHSGGTGASPLSSIKFAGLPWELGVQVTHQVLQANDLRSRVKLTVDGSIQTGRQAVRAFLLGAESVALDR